MCILGMGVSALSTQVTGDYLRYCWKELAHGTPSLLGTIAQLPRGFLKGLRRGGKELPIHQGDSASLQPSLVARDVALCLRIV